MPDSNFNITIDDLTRSALARLGNANPTTDELIGARKAANIVIKALDVHGKWLWAISNTESTLNIVGGTSTYSTGTPPTGIKNDILKLETFALLRGTQRDYLPIMAKPESLTNDDRDSTGEPTLVYLERAPLSASQKIHIYPTPSGSYTGVYTYRRRLYDFDVISDNPDFPPEWMECLEYKLANYLSGSYGTPIAERQWLKAEGDQAFRLLVKANAESVPTETLRGTYF